MALTPVEKSPAQRAPTSGTTLLAPVPLAARSWTPTSWRQALLTYYTELPDHGEQSQGDRGHEREQLGPTEFSNKDFQIWHPE